MGRTAQIDVDALSGGKYEVVVDEFTSARSFEVTVADELYAKFAGGRSKEDFIRDSFRFLLAREPKESILAKFDLSVISKYFPEYEKII